MELVERSPVGRIHSGRRQTSNFQAPANRGWEPRDEDAVLVAYFDIPTNVLERVSAQV
jgi:hypothetical protein